MNKKLTKEQIEKRKQIKNKLMRILNVICYVCTILLIVVAISTGLESCKNSKNKQTQNNKVLKNQLRVSSFNANSFNLDFYKYYYETVYTGVHTLSMSTCEAINDAYDIPNGVYGSQQPSIDKSLLLPEFDSYIYDPNGNSQHLIEMRVGFGSYQGTIGGGSITQYQYRLNYVSFADSNGNWYNFIAKQNNLYTDYDYLFASDLKSLFSKILYDNIIFNNYFELMNIDGYSMFQFRNDLNYYYWANNQNYDKKQIRDLNVDIIYNSEFLNNDEYIIRLQLPAFISNGKVYDEIQLHYTSLEFWDSASHLVPWQLSDGSGKGITVTAGYGFLWEINYVRYDGGQSYIYAESVYKRQEVSMVNNSNTNIDWAFTNDCAWVNQGYRQLIFVQDVNELDSNYQQLISLNSYNSISDYSGGILDVFTLLGTAFTSITSVLGIAVIPGFTIGMLLCLPLAVSLIIIIVKLVKK